MLKARNRLTNKKRILPLGEADLLQEIQLLRARLEKMRADESPRESQSAVSFMVKARRGKVDLFFATDVDFDDCLSHFELCADVNNWSTYRCGETLSAFTLAYLLPIGVCTKLLCLPCVVASSQNSNVPCTNWLSLTAREEREKVW